MTCDSSAWRKVKLSDVADLCLGKMLDQRKNKGELQFYLGNSNVRWGSFDLNNLSKMRFESDEDERYGVEYGDIVLCEGGEPGRCAIWREQIPNMKIQKALHRIRAKSIDRFFLYYKLLDLGKRKFWDNLVTGTTIKHLTGQVLAKIEFEIPPENIQKRIGQVLVPIDEKIAKNQAINDNLAEQGQQILSYFMDKHPFQLTPLGDIALVIDCLHSKKPLSVGNSIHQLIQLENIRDDGFLDMSACKYMISNEDYENWTRKCEIIEGDCVITNVGRIGAISQAPKGTKAAMGRNMTCIRLKPNQGFLSYFITVFLSNHMRRQIQCNTDEGTIMGALNVKNIPKLLIPVFSSSLMIVLENMLHPIRKQIEYNNLQNQRLADLRDALLPRLMSGELDVSEVKL